jgi:casein kinase II subunit alpha
MFGPLPPGNIEMGSIKLDRTGREIDIFPANVKRVKIYPGCVNFLKHFMNQGLNGKTLTKKRLDAIRKKFATILEEISGPKCMEHAEMLMSFRIEFTMALNESHKTLQSLKDQLRPLKAQLLQKLQPYFKSSIIALEDIHTFCRWSLSRYNKICKGNSNTPFDDQLLARHLVLSLWHGVGYHQFRFTQRMHKDYLVDLDMTGYDTDDDDDDELVAQHHRQKIDWSRETDAAINTIIQALQYMNIINVAAASKGSRLRYTYRRVCEFENDAPCPWCYSEKARKNIEEHQQTQTTDKQNLRLKKNYPCKSKDFDTSIELAENVYERVKHHHDISSNGCTELIHSMFVAAREKTKEQEKVLRDMAEMLKKKHPQYTHELFKEFDKPHEQNQDAQQLSKRGRRHVDWSQLTEANVQAILQALAFMNLFKPKVALRPKERAKTGAHLLSNVRPVLLQYMYKKVCDVQTGGDPCSWCYSDAACKQLKKNLGHSQPQKTTVACKSNIFDSADKLIEDVCGRLKHHHPDLSSNDWNKTLTEMFFPIQAKNLNEQQQVLIAMKEKRPVDPEQFQQLSPIIEISSSPTIKTKKEAEKAVSPMVHVYRSKTTTCYQEPDHTLFMTPSGLPNEGNWCYLNSVLQCLRHTRELTSRISSTSQTYQLITNDPGFGIATKLRLFLTSEERIMIPSLMQLRQKLGKYDPKFNGDSMQCASELCERMLTAMFTAHCVSSPAELVRYTVNSAMRCRSCTDTWEGASQEGTLLPITLAGNRSLQSSIDDFLQPELLQDVICNSCSQCRVDRQWSLHTAPDVLIITLTLNYSPNGAKLLSAADNADTVNVGQHRYEIFAVVSHIGPKLDKGHYIAYTETNGSWNCFDDVTVTRNKHWRSRMIQNETPCIFFLRKIAREECIQSRQQHEISAQKQEGPIENTSPVIVGDKNFDDVSSLIAEEPDFMPSILFSVQHETSAQKQEGPIENTSSVIAGDKNVDDVGSLIAEEPDFMPSILFSMQGAEIKERSAFQLDVYMALWKLNMPSPKKRNIKIAKTNFEASSYGGSIRPFLHQATIEMLSTTTDWMDMEANNSFIIHLAVALNKVPLALHTLFARYGKRDTQATRGSSVWTPDVLAEVFPSNLKLKILILSKHSSSDEYTGQVYGFPGQDGENTPDSSVVLVRNETSYSWLQNISIHDVNIGTNQRSSPSVQCVSWLTLTSRSVFTKGCQSSTEASLSSKNAMWDNACAKVGLQKCEKGKWTVKPPGINSELNLQDGSLTPDSFEDLLIRLKEAVNCQEVADLGSEAGHAVARFAFKPFVKQVTGIELQYAWAAYSAIIIHHLQLECRKNNCYLANIHIIVGNFLDTSIQEWKTALSKVTLCFCNNFNWHKGQARPVPQTQMRVDGDFRNSTNANLARLLTDELARNSHAIVFDATHFITQGLTQAYTKVLTLKMQATWTTIRSIEVTLMKICPIRFNDLKTALQTLCQLKSCDFKQMPEHWFENERQPSRKLDYAILKDHVMRISHFAKSNATVHEGWSVMPARNVCIKQFSGQLEHTKIQREITALEQVKGTDASSCNVIEYIGTDQDNNGGTVLIFEMVQASDFYSLSRHYKIDQVKTYMYKLLQALNYLHNHRVVHRDVKPANFLHNFQSYIFRLIDFGSATTEENATGKKGGGTKGFKAPETLMGSKSHTTAVDIWGAGIILFCLLTGKTSCLSGKSDANDLDEIGMIVGKNEMQQLKITACDEYGDGCQFQNKTGWPAKALQTVIAERTWKPDDVALDLLSKMLQVDHSKRINSSTALEHPFFGADKKAAAESRTATGIHQNLTLVIGKNVLARRDEHSQWSPAFVQYSTGKDYQVVFWAGHEERHVTADNVKEIDWKYWNTVMKSWTCDEFDEAIDDSNIEADTKGNIVALANLEIGDVVAKRNGLNAFTEEGGRAESKQQCNSKLWRVDKGSQAVFLVTTKQVRTGDKLKWLCEMTSHSGDAGDATEAKSDASNGDTGDATKAKSGASNQLQSLQQEEQDQFDGADKKAAVESRTATGIHQNLTLVIGKNVLARRDEHSQWSPAFVQYSTGKDYQVVFWAGHEERHVTADNVKEIDWKYWNTVMKSWTCDEFDEAIDDSNIEADTKGNIVALANLEIGDVVAKRNGLNAFTEEGGRAESKQQCNSKLWSVESNNSSFSPNHSKAVFLVTTKRVQKGEKLAWLFKSQSNLCDSKEKVLVLSSAASGNSDSVINNESQQMLDPRTFCIDRTYMKRVKEHFSKDKSVKLLEELLSHNDNFAARIRNTTQSAAALMQARQRDERHSKNSTIGKRTVPNLQNESAAALGYAESSWATVQKMINLFDEALGPSIPAYYLDIGSGSLAHCAIAASASGRFLVCDGIEYGSARFEASQKSLLSARKSGILKSPCKIVFGDVLTSRDIELSTYNVYSFFDKVCIEVSQQTLQKVILEHCATNFALGPVMYLTCMGSKELSEALDQLQTEMEPSEWNSLTILDTQPMNLTTRFAAQTFRCTLVQVRKKR